jgi:type II secretion system protein N
MKRILIGLGAVVWFGFVFLLTFTFTFPSDAIIERVRWEVSERTRDEVAITMEGLGPWWLGASAQDVKVYQAPRRGADKELTYLAKDVRASVAPLSALMRTPRVSGSITPIAGTLYYTVQTGTLTKGKKEELGVTGLQLQADDFPMSEVMILGGLTGSALGGLDLEVDLKGPEGMRTGNGSIVLSGENLVLSDLEIPGVGPLGMELPLDELALNVKVDGGEAEVVRGDVRSPLLTAEVSGTIRLRDDLARSSLNIEILLSNLGSELKMFEPFLKAGDVGGGKYQISCPGTLGDPRCELGKGRTSSRSTRSERSTRPRSRPTTTPRSSRGTDADADTERPDAEELKRRREERLERLRALREQRVERAELADEGDDEEPLDEEEEFYDDEEGEVFDDEEEFLDDEEGYEEDVEFD